MSLSIRALHCTSESQHEHCSSLIINNLIVVEERNHINKSDLCLVPDNTCWSLRQELWWWCAIICRHHGRHWHSWASSHQTCHTVSSNIPSEPQVSAMSRVETRKYLPPQLCHCYARTVSGDSYYYAVLMWITSDIHHQRVPDKTSVVMLVMYESTAVRIWINLNTFISANVAGVRTVSGLPRNDCDSSDVAGCWWHAWLITTLYAAVLV